MKKKRKFALGDRVRILITGIPYDTKAKRKFSPYQGLRGTEGIIIGEARTEYFDCRVSFFSKVDNRDVSFFFDEEHLELIAALSMNPDFTLDEIEKAQELIEG